MPDASSPLLDTPAFQAALARVLVDTAQAASLRESPQEFARDHQLTDDQTTALRAIDARRFADFAHDLLEKRVSLLDKLMPNTLRLLDRLGGRGPLLQRFHQRYLPTHSTVHPNRLIRDAYWLFDMLTAPAVVDELASPHLVDVVTYEFQSARLVNDAEAADEAQRLLENPIHPSCFDRPALDALIFAPGRHVHVQGFAGDVVQVMRLLLDGSPLPSTVTSPTRLMFHRMAHKRRTNAIRINDLTANLFDLLDGRRATAEVLEALAGRHRRAVDDGLWNGVGRMLAQFGANGLIRLIPA